jgi:hypothetical protein
MRNLWTQREVIEMANILGLKNFDRKAIAYYTSMKVFPEPRAELKNVLVMYDDEEIEVGLVDVARRMRTPVKITYDDVKWAKSEVMKTNKAKNVSLLLRKIKANGKS